MRPSLPPRFVAATLLFASVLNAAPDYLQVTDFESLQKLASELARAEYEAPTSSLDPFYEGLQYDDHRQIRFQPEKALFTSPDDTYRVEFFHPGWMFKKPVTFYNLTPGKTAAIPFDAALFDYGNLKVPEGAAPPVGYAGFRILAPNQLANRRFEFLVFMGASYFRAVTTELGYGISARGVAVNTIGGEPEEFPDFTHFWIEPPRKGDEFFTTLALLNGPSLTGAYRFATMPGKTTAMFVTGSLYLRKPVKMLGLAPFSSMFWYGENTHPKPYDFRPEVHDSDGLQIEVEGGPSLWRPLDNGREMRLSFFEVPKLKGFGLAERDRDFKNFEDLEANYHRRPAVWVEPVKGFGEGSVGLIELATGEETWDNIVAFWQPKTLPSGPEEPLHFEYRIDWLEEHLPGLLAKVIATRRGFVMKSDTDHLYVIDFSHGLLEPEPPADWVPEVKVELIGGDAAEVLDARVMKNPETRGWRAFFQVRVPETSKLIEMSAELKRDDKVISEKWTYQWRR